MEKDGLLTDEWYADNTFSIFVAHEVGMRPLDMGSTGRKLVSVATLAESVKVIQKELAVW